MRFRPHFNLEPGSAKTASCVFWVFDPRPSVPLFLWYCGVASALVLLIHWRSGLSWLVTLPLAGLLAVGLFFAFHPVRALRRRLALSPRKPVRKLAGCEAHLVACHRAADGSVSSARVMSFEKLLEMSPPERHGIIREIVRSLRLFARLQSEQRVRAQRRGGTDQPQIRPEPISFWGWFESADQESRFRLHSLRFDTLQAALAVSAGMVSTLAFIPADIRILGVGDSFRLLLTYRLVFAFASGLCLLALRQKPQPKILDRLMLGWLSLAILLMFNVGATRVSIFFLGYAITGLIALGLLYAVVPLPLPYQLAIAALVTMVDLLLLLPSHPEIDPVLRNTVIFAYAIMMVVGSAVSWSARRSRRQQFAALDRETVLRIGLETALAEVQTLSGIVPICSQCKKVRNDDGYWQQVEVYAGARLEAQFSHGLCPDCMSKFRLQQSSEERRIERIYHCVSCPKAFRVESQAGDRTAAEAPEVSVKVPCPFCGAVKEITWPKGSRFILAPAVQPTIPPEPLHRWLQDWRGQSHVQ